MITYIRIKDSYKSNWIDQNNVVFGYDEEQQCCEYSRTYVCDKDGKILGKDIVDLPYHFDFAWGAVEDDLPFPIPDWDENEKGAWEYPDIVAVRLLTDDEGNTEPLYFVCLNSHNGYYYHDFDFRKVTEEDKDLLKGDK